MNKIHRILIVIFVFNVIIIDSYGQKTIKEYVQNNFDVIKSIDTSYRNYVDLEPIGNAIGDSRVVMLGEQDHGDAPTFLAKTRLIKYLHEKRGFDVLAFEGDFYALNKGLQQLSNPRTEIADFLKRNIYPIWTTCRACSNLLYTYIPSTYSSSSPLMIAGLDNQIMMPFSMNNFANDLDSLLRTPEMKKYFTSATRQIIISSVGSILKDKRSGKSIDRKTKYLILPKLNVMDSLISLENGPHTFWVESIENLISLINLAPESRDKQMSANLQWLVKYAYPGQKIIVWSANAHIVKYTSQMSEQIGSKAAREVSWFHRSMGTYFTDSDSLSRQTYVLGFTSARGTAGRLGGRTFHVPNPMKGSFESWIDTSNQYGFVDFRQFNKTHPNDESRFQLKPFMHMYYPRKFDWNRAFDGIFYIRDMYSCNEDKRR